MRLDREVVVRAALGLLNEVGLEGLTLRRIAQELNVQAPALYWHFKNKQALLDEMATAMLMEAIGDFGAPPDGDEWRHLAAETGRGLRRMLLRYRDGARVFSGTYLTTTRPFAAMEESLAVFTAAGFSLDDAAIGFGTISSYTVGFTIEEQAVHPRPGEHNAQYDLAKRDERLDPERYPLARAAGKAIFADFDGRFERGLQLIIAGLAQALAPRN